MLPGLRLSTGPSDAVNRTSECGGGQECRWRRGPKTRQEGLDGGPVTDRRIPAAVSAGGHLEAKGCGQAVLSSWLALAGTFS